ARDLARFVAHVNRDNQTGAAEAGDLQTLKPHAALAENGHCVRDPQLGCLHRRDAVAQGLEARRLTVGDSVVHFHQGNLRKRRNFGEASRQVEANHRSLAAKVAALGTAEGAFATRQFGTRRNTVAWLEARHSIASFDDAGAKLMAKKLKWGLGFEPAFDAV